jgi:4-amino-4-deoxy-L-arabinose transferase-like glycosyltransferase
MRRLPVCERSKRRGWRMLLESGIFKIHHQSWLQIAFLLGFCIVFYFLALGRWELREPDETRYAQVAREIVEGGDWISMHLHGRPYLDKPPLFFWLIAGSSYLWGSVTPVSARFPSALLGSLTVLIVFFMGKALYDSRTGFLSALILATSFGFARFSTRAHIDATLTFFTTASFFSFLQWYRWNEEGSPRQKDVRRLSIYGFYVSMALATLTKGPIGIVFPLMPSLLFLLIQKDWRGIREMRLLSGLGLFLAIVLSWYLPAAFKGGQTFLNETLFHQTVDYYSTGWDHPKPIYFYLANFPGSFLPWSLFLPGAMVYGYFEWRKGKRKEVLFVFTWFIVIFLFLSFSLAKRNLYLLPLYPAASLIVSKLWGDLLSNQMRGFRQEWISFPIYALIGLIFLLGLIILWAISKRLPSYFLSTLPITVFLMVGSWIVFFMYRSKRYGNAFFLLVGIIAVGFFYIEHSLFLLDEQFKSAGFILNFIKGEFGLFLP